MFEGISPWLVPLGVAVGTFGTLIGAGGGFLLIPLLILLYPEKSASTITSISLAVVFCNAFSGSIAYARMRRIDYRSGIQFALAAIPAAVLGALTTSLIPRRIFDATFGTLMLAAGVALLIWPEPPERQGADRPGTTAHRTITEADGTVHRYSFNPRAGIAASGVAGYISSLLGIGGGIVHVPVMVYLLGFPTHVATATSHFVLAWMALAGTVTHAATGSYAGVLVPTALMGGGVLVGAQFGAALSNRVHGSAIIRGLAAALAFVGLRILWGAL